jgi:tRNA nucleotidyltransferase (CCA-adding enzyme)
MQIPQPVIEVCQTLRARGRSAFVVGGSVRDMLLARPARDWDVATEASGEDVARWFPRINPVGLRHNTVGICHGGMWIEVTTFRDPAVSLDGDLGLRDFTCNAMALDPETGNLIDPLGGKQDLAARRLRACGSAHERFAEDPLRMVRAARFYADIGCIPDEEVTGAAFAGLATLAGVAPERIRDEWIKLLLGPEVAAALQWAAATGLLERLFPAADLSRGVTQNRWHRWDVFYHTIQTVSLAAPSAEVRLAAFFHDLGKPRTRRWKGGDWTFYNHERISAEIAAADLDRYRFGHDQAKRIVSLVQNHMFHYDPSWTDAAVRRFVRRVTPELLDDQFALRAADSAATGIADPQETAGELAALRRRIEAELAARHAFQIRDLAVDGHDMARLAGGQGAKVGILLRYLLEVVTDDPSANDRDTLLRAAEAHLGRLQN